MSTPSVAQESPKIAAQMWLNPASLGNTSTKRCERAGQAAIWLISADLWHHLERIKGIPEEKLMWNQSRRAKQVILCSLMACQPNNKSRRRRGKIKRKERWKRRRNRWCWTQLLKKNYLIWCCNGQFNTSFLVNKEGIAQCIGSSAAGNLGHERQFLNIQMSMDLWKLWFIEPQEMFSSIGPHHIDDMKPVRQSIVLSDHGKLMCPRLKKLIDHKVSGYNYMQANSRGGTSFQNSPTGMD